METNCKSVAISSGAETHRGGADQPVPAGQLRQGPGDPGQRHLPAGGHIHRVIKADSCMRHKWQGPGDPGSVTLKQVGRFSVTSNYRLSVCHTRQGPRDPGQHHLPAGGHVQCNIEVSKS